MKLCIIRLGKDSVNAITQIDSLYGVQPDGFTFSLVCKQVPNEVNRGTFCLIWLGSDNNKGTPTKWAQGLRAFGKVDNKAGGPNYNDEWKIDITLQIVFSRSINHQDFLIWAPDQYHKFSGMPIIGINTHSNQTVQMVREYEPNQQIPFLIYAINSIESTFIDSLNVQYPSFYQADSEASLPAPSELPNSEDVEIEDNQSLNLMDRPFNPSLINIDNKLLTIDLLIKRLSQSPAEIDLYPDFQRKDDLWDSTKQSRLIESILIRFPLPAFYFDGSDRNKWLVVDGLQRLSSLRNFAINKTLRLSNLEFLSKLNGCGYDDLDRDLQRVIEETQVVAYIINPGTPHDVKFNIFKRINTGGLVLEPQEIRHALFQGTPSKFVAELANLEEFKQATSYAIRPDRMLDRDFVNRFLAFYILGFENYVPDLDSYMNDVMATLYSLEKNQLFRIKEDFQKSMITNYAIFGKLAFRKQLSFNERRRPINKALFDVFSVCIAKLSDTERDALIKNKHEINNELINLINNDFNFFASISSSTSERAKVHYRFSTITKLIDKYSIT